MLLADDLGNACEQALHVIDELRDHPGTGDQEHREDGEQLRNERQRHLVDLGGGLEDAHHETHDERGEKQRRRHEHRHEQCLLGDGQNGLAIHPKLATSDPMRRFQPSTSTNSMSLKGREMSTGESIIMPIDMSTLATTMSMIRKG